MNSERMTIRDRFAAWAIAGMAEPVYSATDRLVVRSEPAEIARRAYEIADAMMTRRLTLKYGQVLNETDTRRFPRKD